ncbi:MAG: hypothetical protein QOE70_4740 [Chthoniobacter sp.]|jgi:hypothetical protein|nr:hypothetical protein [Chthoniobacter sp.]
MDKLTALSRLEARLDRALGIQPDIEFGLLSGLAIGGGVHLGANAVVKRMLKPGTFAQRIGTSIFRKGARDARAGKMIHPAVRNVAKVALGPEAAHIYDAGLHSTVWGRGAVRRAEVLNGDLGKGVRGIVGGKRSGVTDKVLDLMPLRPRSRGEKLRDSIPAAAAGAVFAGATHDWVLPAMNAGRTAIAESSLGKKAMRAAAMKGGYHGPQTGVARALQDHVVAPSLNVARDAGSMAYGRMPPRRVKEVPRWRSRLNHFIHDQTYQG